MDPVRLKRLDLEEKYFKIYRRWYDAGRNQDRYDEAALKFLFMQLELSYKDVGYHFGNRYASGPATKG